MQNDICILQVYPLCPGVDWHEWSLRSHGRNIPWQEHPQDQRLWQHLYKASTASTFSQCLPLVLLQLCCHLGLLIEVEIGNQWAYHHWFMGINTTVLSHTTFHLGRFWSHMPMFLHLHLEISSTFLLFFPLLFRGVVLITSDLFMASYTSLPLCSWVWNRVLDIPVPGSAI